MSSNGKDVALGEIELLTAASAGTAATPHESQFTLEVKERISKDFAQIINDLFLASVLTPGQQAATVDLEAQVDD